MYEIGYAGSRILVTFGSVGKGSVDGAYVIGGSVDTEILVQQKESLLQEWHPTDERWKPAPAVMARRYAFSAVTVEARHVCRQGEGLFHCISRTLTITPQSVMET
jgi:hypothetical protein